MATLFVQFLVTLLQVNLGSPNPIGPSQLSGFRGELRRALDELERVRDVGGIAGPRSMLPPLHAAHLVRQDRVLR